MLVEVRLEVALARLVALWLFYDLVVHFIILSQSSLAVHASFVRPLIVIQWNVHVCPFCRDLLALQEVGRQMEHLPNLIESSINEHV